MHLVNADLSHRYFNGRYFNGFRRKIKCTRRFSHVLKQCLNLLMAYFIGAIYDCNKSKFSLEIGTTIGKVS